MSLSLKQLTIVTLCLALALLVGLACSVQDAAAKPAPGLTLNQQFGVLTVNIGPKESMAVTAEFSQPFETAPVCTDGVQPSTVNPAIAVVLMTVEADSVTYFVDNPNENAESVAIHWHCIGQ